MKTEEKIFLLEHSYQFSSIPGCYSSKAIIISWFSLLEVTYLIFALLFAFPFQLLTQVTLMLK